MDGILQQFLTLIRSDVSNENQQELIDLGQKIEREIRDLEWLRIEHRKAVARLGRVSDENESLRKSIRDGSTPAASEKGRLILSRHKGEQIILNDGEIEITIVDIRGDKVRIGIIAPKDLPVHRREVYEAIKSQKEAEPCTT